MFEQFQSHTDDTRSPTLGYPRVPAPRHGPNLRQSHERQPREGYGQRHQKAGEALGRTYLHPCQPETTLRILEGLLDPTSLPVPVCRTAWIFETGGQIPGFIGEAAPGVPGAAFR